MNTNGNNGHQNGHAANGASANGASAHEIAHNEAAAIGSAVPPFASTLPLEAPTLKDAPDGQDVRNVIIIGSGPSGYTAALYTARANLQPLMIAGGVDPKTSRIKGGQLMQTSDIENFPGAIEVPEGVDLSSVAYLDDEGANAAAQNVKGYTGPDLMARMELQARHFGTEMLGEFVTEVDLCADDNGLYKVVTETGKTFYARSIIVSTGAAAKTLGIEAEDKFYGQDRGVSTCATCDGASYARLGDAGVGAVAVVGGGDSAMEEATYLARLDGIKKVYLVHRRDEFRASKIMLTRAQNNPKIEMLLHKRIADIAGQPDPRAATIKFFAGKEIIRAAVLEDTQSGERSELPVDGIFVAIGHTPNTGLFKDQLKMDEAGYLLHDGHMRALPSSICSSAKMRAMEYVPGVFVSGDVADHTYRQAITAAGMGCMAAIEAERYLAEKMAVMAGVSPDEVDLSTESLAQSHWSSERDNGEVPMIERVAEAVAEKE